MPESSALDQIAKSLATIDLKLNEMVQKQVEIGVKQDHLDKTSFRLMLAMLGIIAATLGTKLMGTPGHLIAATYAALFSGIFLLGVVCTRWRQVHWSRSIVRLVLAILILFSTGVRAFVYEAGLQAAPVWFSPTIDILYVILSVACVLSVWKDRRI